MRGLTLWSPWAGLVASGRKTLECRGRRTSYRGPVAIHAGLMIDEVTMDAVALCRRQGELDDATWALCQASGAIIAVAELVDCRTWRGADPRRSALRSDESRLRADLDAQEGRIYEQPETWAGCLEAVARKGAWLWELARARSVRPVPCRGMQGLWPVDERLLAQIGDRS